jgi:hypothetical protein
MTIGAVYNRENTPSIACPPLLIFLIEAFREGNLEKMSVI